MKTLLLSFLALSSFATAHAYDGPFSNRYWDHICTGFTISNSGYTLNCKGATNYSKVRFAKTGRNVNEIPRVVIAGVKDAISDFGVMPDADTSQIYGYSRELTDSRGKVIGYLFVDGYANSETEEKLQLNHTYNLRGELITATVK